MKIRGISISYIYHVRGCTFSLSILLWFLDSVLLLKVIGTFLIVFTTLFVIYVEFKEIGKRNELFDALTEIMDKNGKKSSD